MASLRPIMERQRTVSSSWSARSSWQPWTRLLVSSHDGWQPRRQRGRLSTGKGHWHARQRLSILQWNCRSITGIVPFLLDYLQTHSQVDVLMLQSLNVQARALNQLDGYYYLPVTRSKVAELWCQLMSAAGWFRLTTCAVSIPTKGSNRQTSLVNVYYPAGSSKINEVTWLKHQPWDGQLGGGWKFQHQSQTVGCYCYSFE